MQNIDVEAVKTNCKFQSSVEVVSIFFDSDVLVVTVISNVEKKIAKVKFIEVLGFRLLDEGNLLEFWPACASENGWLFLVKNNGWLELESSRPGFLLEKGTGLFEYFIAGRNSCLSVFSSEAPSVET